MRGLGVGLVYWSALQPLFGSGDAEVLELEPQTLWTKSWTSSRPCYRLNEALFDSIAVLPQPKLIHGVGQPLGGSVDDPLEYAPLLRQMLDRLNPAWVSEHLSFNRTRRQSGVSECGFLLPPAQTPAAVRVAAENIARYGRALGRPVAFETGVNYFRSAPADLRDGKFFAEVAETADCGILLDLHNLWCNERNGRQSVQSALLQLPLDRVWEIHFAGGRSLDGYWLDAHSGEIPPAILDVAAEIIPRLKNVGALIFEILPEHLETIGLDGVQRQLEALRQLWSLRTNTEILVRCPAARSMKPSAADIAQVRAWEIALMNALEGAPGESFKSDPGIGIMRRLISDFRSASLTRGMRFTITALLAALGAEQTELLLSTYLRSTAPDSFVAVESLHFARFLSRRPELIASIPYLAEVLRFEKALLSATLYGSTTELHWSTDPTLLLAELEVGRLPRHLPNTPSRMTIAQ